jgi:hypothetical protein
VRTVPSSIPRSRRLSAAVDHSIVSIVGGNQPRYPVILSSHPAEPRHRGVPVVGTWLSLVRGPQAAAWIRVGDDIHSSRSKRSPNARDGRTRSDPSLRLRMTE